MDRYTSPAMAALWSDAARYERWRLVELAVLAARAHLADSLPDGDAAVHREALEQAESISAPDPRDVRDAELTTKHDVVAFLVAWTGQMSPDAAAHVHQGLTSSDVVDTATAMALKEVSALLDRKATRLLRALAVHAREHAGTVRLARTHGQPAGPDTWGHRAADFGFAIARTRDRLRTSASNATAAKISGPVGSYTGVSRAVEQSVADRLGLSAPNSATQVLFRDTLAAWGSDCAAIVAVCEAIATEVRLGAVFEVGELSESKTSDQVGSSAVPSKRNPILSEKLTGLARVLRGSVGPLLEDVALWQHRDISQSSVERVELPQISALTEHVLDTTLAVIEGLVVDAPKMRANLEAAGLLAAGPAVLDYLTAAGVDRLRAIEAIETAVVATSSVADARDGADHVTNLEEAYAVYRDTIVAATGVSLPYADPLAHATNRILDNDDLHGIYDRLDQVAKE